MVDVRVAAATEPGSAEELARFAALQAKLAPLAKRVLSDPRSSQTVVVVPSLTLDAEELAKIPGAHHYEERLLCMLMPPRLPRRFGHPANAEDTRPPAPDGADTVGAHPGSRAHDLLQQHGARTYPRRPAGYPALR